MSTATTVAPKEPPQWCPVCKKYGEGTYLMSDGGARFCHTCFKKKVLTKLEYKPREDNQ